MDNFRKQQEELKRKNEEVRFLMAPIILIFSETTDAVNLTWQMTQLKMK